METGGHTPGVGERRVSQDAAKRRAKIRITTELAGGGKANQNRQNDKCRRAAHIQHDVDGVTRVDPAVRFNHPQKAHQQAGGDDSRDDRHKDVRQQAGNALERIQFFRRNVGSFRFAGFANPCRLDKGGVDFVHHPGAEDNLHLSGVTETALHPINFADGLLIGQ